MARIKPQALLNQSKKKKTQTQISLSTIITFNLVIFLIVFSLYSTYKYWYRRPSDQQENYNYEQTPMFEETKKLDDLPGYAILNTAKGSITAELYKDASPEVVDKFLESCQKGHFKGMLFHRVIKHYVIQGGDSQELGGAEDWIQKGKANSKLDTSPKHEAFMLGTTKGKSDNKGFELFITTAPIPDLSEKLVVFGRVIRGEDVVQEIEEVDTDEHYRPKSPIGIIDIELKHKP